MITLRAFLQRQSRRFLILAVVGTLCMILAWAHSGAGDDHMARDEMGHAISTCLAVIQCGLGILLAAVALRAIRRRHPPRSLLPPAGQLLPAGPAPPTPIQPRAGPAILQVFRS